MIIREAAWIEAITEGGLPLSKTYALRRSLEGWTEEWPTTELGFPNDSRVSSGARFVLDLIGVQFGLKGFLQAV